MLTNPFVHGKNVEKSHISSVHRTFFRVFIQVFIIFAEQPIHPFKTKQQKKSATQIVKQNCFISISVWYRRHLLHIYIYGWFVVVVAQNATRKCKQHLNVVYFSNFTMRNYANVIVYWGVFNWNPLKLN